MQAVRQSRLAFRLPFQAVQRYLSTTRSTNKRVCIVGGGPAGFYTAHFLLKQEKAGITQIDVLEKLPVPYGLVRFGVAPDHPEVKNVISTFEQVADHSKCNVYCNVDVGTGISIDALRKNYDSVVLAYGASEDRQLGITGESLSGVHSARRVVGWYNGLPEDQDIPIDLANSETAVIIGHGNVALDIARILLTPPENLAHTDITSSAMEALEQSSIRKVYCVGRRGPLEVAFTIKELREMTKIPNCKVIIDSDFPLTKEESEYVANTRPRKRLTALMEQNALKPNDNPTEKEFHVVFRSSPAEIHSKPDSTSVGSITFARNDLNGPMGSRSAAPNGETLELDTDLVIRSIGYLGKNIDESLPFDEKRGVIMNDSGRIAGLPGVHCCGWIQHSPSGVILNTMHDAQACATQVTTDLSDNVWQRQSNDSIGDLLSNSNVVTNWQAIHEAEVAEGERKGKPREKFTDINDMIEISRIKNT